MLQRCALVKNSVVDNIVLLPDGPVPLALAAQYEHVLHVGDAPCGPGWLYDHGRGAFTAPPDEEPEAPAPARRITVGAFLLRFGELAVPILTSDIAAVRACVTIVQSMTFIDLDDPALHQYLSVLVQAGLSTQKQLDAILAAPITDRERPASIFN